MQETNKVYRRLFESSNAPILIIDPDFNIIECNHMVSQLLETPRNEIIGKTPVEISPEFQLNGVSSSELGKKYFTAAIEGQDLRFEWIHLKKDGTEVIVEVSLFGFVASGKENFFAMWRDLTEIREKQNELEKYQNQLEDLVDKRTEELSIALEGLKKAQTQLIQSEKMASLGVMTAGIAHEINNPLNYIMGGYTGLSSEFEGKDFSDNRIPTFLEGIRLGVERVSEIVKGLNQMSRDSDNYAEDCEVHAILDNCLTILKGKLTGNIDIEKYFSSEKIVIQGNAGKLHQVFINIISNAIDSIKESGQIIITTETDGDQVKIRLEDTGCGIEEDHIHMVADPFFTTKDPGKGTGLGLSIANNIVHSHGGRLTFESTRNKGTIVFVQIPVSRNDGQD